MSRHPRMLTTLGTLLVAISASQAGFAQKPGGVLRVHALDSPPSLSMHEEVDANPARAAMGIFNNLVMFDQHVKQNSMQSHRARPRRQLVLERGGNRADLPTTRRGRVA